MERSGLGISAFACHANPVHPVKEIAERFDRIMRSGVLVAEKMGVDTLVTFSGAPADCPESTRPNWVTHVFPYDGIATLDYQWNKCLIPYWRDFAKFAKQHGVRIAIEMHPGWAVSDPESLICLRENCGDNIGANFDPSHPDLARRRLPHRHPQAQRHDLSLPRQGHARRRGRNGQKWLLHPFRPHLRRPAAVPVQDSHLWNGELYWKKMLTALRESGYDGTLSIEHEDTEFGQFDGVIRACEILRSMIYREPAAHCSWKASIKDYQSTFLPNISQARRRRSAYEDRIVFQRTARSLN